MATEHVASWCTCPGRCVLEGQPNHELVAPHPAVVPVSEVYAFLLHENQQVAHDFARNYGLDTKEARQP
jgi:hypothetical protein